MKKRGLTAIVVTFVVLSLFPARSSSSRPGVDVSEVRVDTMTNGVASFTMPFEPLPGVGPGAFLEGDFDGDGGKDSDILLLCDQSGDAVESAAWADGVWIDPETGLPSLLRVEPGDPLVFVRSDPEPFSFTVFGKEPASASDGGTILSSKRGAEGRISPRDVPRLAPEGFSVAGLLPGLAAACYAFSDELTSFPDVSSLVPAATAVVSRLDFNVTTEAWDWMPTNLVDRFAAVFEGLLLVDDPGLHTLKLFSDDGALLYLDGSLLIDRNGINSMTPTTADVLLSPGYHTLRVEYFDNLGHAGLVLWWTRPGQWEESVASDRLWHAEGPYDTDGDGMPDWWEEAHGLDFADPSDAALDPDGDGLSNLAEFRAGTDPHSADSDGDGMPDAWEVANGTCPFLADALADPDGDGLANVEEMRFGADPLVSDTDGDGISDYDECLQLGTNPAAADSVCAGAPVQSTQAGRSCAFEAPGRQAFAVTARILHEWRDYARDKRPVATSNRIVFRVDGHFVAYRDVPFDVSNVVNAVFYTPVLPAGVHGVSVETCSPDFRVRADIVGLAVNELSGVDFGEVVRRRNSPPEGPLASRASPAFVEGSARFPWLVSATNLTVRPSGSDSWYVDVPLSPGEEVPVPVCFEGLVTTNLTVAWQATDLFSETDDIAIRRGSSLLFAGGPGAVQCGTVSVYTNDALACSYAVGSSAALRFDNDGPYAVGAVWTPEGEGSQVASSEIAVVCVGGSFPSASPACMVGASRSWSCPEMSTNAVFSSDAYTHFGMSSAGVAMLLVDDTRGDRIVAARISEGGPVLDVARIDPMWAVDSFGNVAYLVESSEDHDRCRCYMRQYGASDSVLFRVDSCTSSLLFDDYSTTRWLPPSEFDEDGIAWFEFLKTRGMASPCHTVTVYQDGAMIGEAVYGNGMLPEELR